MRNFLFILLLMIAVPSFSQRVDKPGEPYDYYLHVWPYMDFGKGISVKLKVRFAGMKEKSLVDENGKKLTFSNLSEAITYMSKRGWEFVDQFSYDKEHVFLMKKQVTDDSQAKDNLHTEE